MQLLGVLVVLLMILVVWYVYLTTPKQPNKTNRTPVTSDDEHVRLRCKDILDKLHKGIVDCYTIDDGGVVLVRYDDVYDIYCSTELGEFYPKRWFTLLGLYGHSEDASIEVLKTYLDKMVWKKSNNLLVKEFVNGKSGLWVNINDGEYYVKTKSCGNMSLFKFETWEDDSCSHSSVKINKLELCEDPRKTHWKHFLHLEMTAKKARQDECYSFVEEVIKQQKEYNDLQLTYAMIPTTSITDVDTFNNFCKIVSKKHEYADYEIQEVIFNKQRGK